tara:strand:+ start:199 stop:339 length:141 start_codon:yes stop_codon:yes gene_type:complete
LANRKPIVNGFLAEKETIQEDNGDNTDAILNEESDFQMEGGKQQTN